MSLVKGASRLTLSASGDLSTGEAMQRIPVTEAQAGMILAKPVQRDNGMTILGKGTELSQSVIDRLTRMDIAHVVVQGHPLAQDGDQGSGSYEHMLSRLDHLFRGHEDDEWMQEVKTFLSGFFRLKTNLEHQSEPGPEEDDS